MPTEKKGETIDQLTEVFSKATIGIITDYRGLTATKMSFLRRSMRDANIEFKVVKNTLARIAAEKAGNSDLARSFEGPTAIAFGYSDITQPAKALLEYIRASRETLLKIKGGFLRTRLITADEVTTLSTLPSRDVLLARVMGGIQAPISSLVVHLASPIRGFIGLLEARRKQLEETGGKEEAQAA
ncbi:MAG: 50S ribosomal protein L10 [Chloroflexota bacterium]